MPKHASNDRDCRLCFQGKDQRRCVLVKRADVVDIRPVKGRGVTYLTVDSLQNADKGALGVRWYGKK